MLGPGGEQLQQIRWMRLAGWKYARYNLGSKHEVLAMGYDSTDTKALQTAAEHGITIVDRRSIRFASGVQDFFTMDCPSQLALDEPQASDSHEAVPQTASSAISPAGKCLARAIEAVTRIYAGSRLWVRVDGDVLPEYVREAVANLAGFGTRMVVTQGDACSHAPGPRLDPLICQAVVTANEGGQVWHPFADKAVFNLDLA